VAGATFWADSATSRPDFGVDLEAIGTRSFAFSLGDRFTVFVAELVELSLAPTGGDPGDEDGRDRAERRVVVLALDYDESVVALSQGRVDVAAVIGSQVEGLAQAGVAGLGDALVCRHQPGLVDLGHKAGEGTHTGQIGEAVEVARVAQNGRREDGPETRGGADDSLGVGLVIESTAIRLSAAAISSSS
jgi:hypothetical protein